MVLGEQEPASIPLFWWMSACILAPTWDSQHRKKKKNPLWRQNSILGRLGWEGVGQWLITTYDNRDFKAISSSSLIKCGFLLAQRSSVHKIFIVQCQAQPLSRLLLWILTQWGIFLTCLHKYIAHLLLIDSNIYVIQKRMECTVYRSKGLQEWHPSWVLFLDNGLIGNCVPNERPFEVSEELFNAAEKNILFLFTDRECALDLFVWHKESEKQVRQPNKLNN